MKRKITKYTMLVFAAILSSIKMYAQHAIGLIAGNKNTPYAVFNNPSLGYSDKNYFYLNVYGLNFGFTNNFLQYNAPFRLGEWARNGVDNNFQNNNGTLQFNKNWLPMIEGNESRKLYYFQESYGPSLFFRIHPNYSMGFGFKGVSGLSMNGVDNSLARLIRYGADSLNGTFGGNQGLKYGETYKNGAFAIAIDNYQEWFVNLAGVSLNRGKHFFKWGATGKFLVGTGAANIAGSSINFGFNQNNQAYLENTNLTFAHSGDQSVSNALSSPFGFGWFKGIAGIGAGMDIGFTYENRKGRPNANYRDYLNCNPVANSGYRWRLGASLTDLGFIGYDGSSTNLDIDNKVTYNTNNKVIDANAHAQQNYDRLNRIDTGFFQRLGGNTRNGFVNSTPAALNVQLDINLGKKFYLGANWSQSIKDKDALGLRKASYLSVIPRWENEYSEIGLPITMTRDYTALNVGIYGRFGPVIIGTDNIGGLLKYAGNNKYQSANVYAALRFKFGVCHEEYYENYEKIPDTIKQEIRDTTRFWEADTIVQRDTIIQRDTIYKFKEKIVRDTIYKTTTQPSTELKKKEDELKKRETDLAKKEAELRKKEEEIKRKSENPRDGGNGGNGNNCCIRATQLEDELRRERDLYRNLEISFNNQKDENQRLRADVIRYQNEAKKCTDQILILQNDNSRLKIEITDLKKEIVRLKMNNNPCAAQTRTLDSLLNIEKQNNSKLQAQVVQLKTTYDKLKSDCDNSNKRIAELEKEIANLNAQVANNKKCTEDLARLDAELKAEKQKNVDLNKQLEETKSSFQVVSNKNKQLEEQLKSNNTSNNCDELKNKNIQLEKELNEVKSSFQVVNNKNKQLEEQLKNNSNACIEWKTKSETLEKELNETKSSFQVVNNKNKQLEEQLKNCGNNEELNKKIAELERKIEEYKNEYEGVSKQLILTQQKLKDCEAKGGNSGEIEKLKSEVEVYKNKAADAESKLKQAEEEEAKCKQNLSNLQAQVTNLQKQLSDCQSKSKENDCSELQSQLNNYKEKFNKLEGEYNVLKTEQNSLKQEISDLTAQLAAAKRKGEDCEECKSNLSSLQTKVTNLEQQLNGRNQTLQELQAKLGECNSERNKCNENISSMTEELNKLRKEIEGLQEQLKNLTK